MMRFVATLAVAAVALAPPVNAGEKAFDVIGSSGVSIGSVGLRSGPHGTTITVSISKLGLRPGWHGIHIHQVGNCDDHGKFEQAKGHVNPSGKQHGLHNPNGPHPADLPNIYAHVDGSVNAELYAAGVFLGSSKGSLLDDDGSAIVIHANPDDHMS